jgi:hypothetical protein
MSYRFFGTPHLLTANLLNTKLMTLHQESGYEPPIGNAEVSKRTSAQLRGGRGSG